MVTQGKKKKNTEKLEKLEKAFQQAPLKMAEPNCSLATYIMHLEMCEPLYLHSKHNRLISHKTWLAVY